jgi:hypothetical protein
MVDRAEKLALEWDGVFSVNDPDPTDDHGPIYLQCPDGLLVNFSCDCRPGVDARRVEWVAKTLNEAMAQTDEPMAWRVKDFAAGWFVTQFKAEADYYIRNGHAVEPLYARAALTAYRQESAVEKILAMSDDEIMAEPGAHEAAAEVRRLTQGVIDQHESGACAHKPENCADRVCRERNRCICAYAAPTPRAGQPDALATLGSDLDRAYLTPLPDLPGIAVTDRTPQPFEAYPRLAAWIEKLANRRIEGFSHASWCAFLSELNAALSLKPQERS